MKKYLVVHEKSADGYSAYVPDLPGCTSVGADRDEIGSNIVEAIRLPLEVMEEERIPIPESTPYSQMLVLTK